MLEKTPLNHCCSLNSVVSALPIIRHFGLTHYLDYWQALGADILPDCLADFNCDKAKTYSFNQGVHSALLTLVCFKFFVPYKYNFIHCSLYMDSSSNILSQISGLFLCFLDVFPP